jgi:antitoxin YokJ
LRCHVHLRRGVPSTKFPLPPDLVTFYELCGGIELFPDRPFGFRILPPEELQLANPVLLGEFYIEHKAKFDADISANWYLVAKGTSSPEAITIDLQPDRAGRCYDSFWDVYATPNSKIVAGSFTELVASLYNSQGENLFWEKSSFALGCAYDSILR